MCIVVTWAQCKEMGSWTLGVLAWSSGLEHARLTKNKKTGREQTCSGTPRTEMWFYLGIDEVAEERPGGANCKNTTEMDRLELVKKLETGSKQS